MIAASLAGAPHAFAAVQGCVVTEPANPVSANPCRYAAGDVGFYTASGDWRLTIARGGQTIVYSSAQGSPAAGAPGIIEPGDFVTGQALTTGSQITFGNPSPLAQGALPGVGGPSGCDSTRTAGAYHPGAQPANGPLAPRPCIFHTGYDAAEPTLGVTRAGNVFLQAVGFDSQADSFGSAYVLRSRDGGGGWENVSPLIAGGAPAIGNKPVHAASGDPYLYVDKRTSRVFTSDFVDAQTPTIAPGECDLFSYTGSADAPSPGWSNGIAGCEEGDHQTIFAGPPPAGGLHPSGYPDVVYYCAAAAGDANFSAATLCDRSLDGGRSFTVTGTPPYNDDPRQADGDYGVPGACEGEAGHGTVDANGVLYLPRSWCGHPWLAISRDEGLTWSHVQVSTMRAAVTSSGRREHEAGVAVHCPHKTGPCEVSYFWIGHDRLPYLAVSRDGGRSFGKPMMVAPPGVTQAVMPAIDAGPNGGLELVFLGTTNAPGQPFPERDDCKPTVAQPTLAADCAGQENEATDEERFYANTTWNGYIAETGDPLARNPLFYAASVNDPSDPLHRGACVHECDPEFDFLGVFADGRGTPWSAYVDGCEGPCIAKGHDNAREGVVGKLVGGPVL